ncbi:MAG: pseudaminic acid synthase [Patescibacteria group bacterium]
MKKSNPVIINTPKGRRKIGPGEPSFIIAEMSGNHNRNYEKAEEIVREAAKAGADAIKLQTYTADTITIDSKKPWFMEKNKENPAEWQGTSLYELYTKGNTPWEWHKPLKALAESLGLAFFSTPFDTTAVDFLEDLGVDFYKIASYESTDHLLMKKIASTGKPIIMSLGYPTRDETDESVAFLRSLGVNNLILLHCVTYYSDKLDPAQSYLATMLDMAQRYEVPVGLSDNNGGIEVPVLAIALGASVLEKHMIIAKEEGGNDSRFSLSAKNFADMVSTIRQVEKDPESFVRGCPWLKEALGSVVYGPRSEQENYNMKFRRSLFVVEDIKRGETFTSQNIRSIRPNIGLETKYFWDIIGKKATRNIERAEPLSWDMIERIES